MDNEKMGRFITQLRREKNLTQKDLASQLGITDKAVSKWERGLSCPDIALLSPLANILSITTTQLLNGEKTDVTPPAIESAVEATLQFASTATKHKSEKIRTAIAICISALFLLGIVSCAICNVAISGKLTWALFPISSIVFAWLSAMPGIVWGKKGVITSLIVFSLLIIPFLFALERIIGTVALMMSIGVKASIAGVIYLWCSYILFFKTKLYKFAAAAFCVLLAIPVSVVIDNIVDMAIQGRWIMDVWDIFTCGILLIAAIILLSAGYMKHKSVLIKAELPKSVRIF